ncbi:MAG: exonuclease SbcCD subunit D [Lachnospiraceae bacterium]|nr:exonuclease SbcCD subunit D [Lachnospiraceae bacterium]
MKFLHLSDLHIGKRVNEFSMLEDQKYIFEQILDIVDVQKIEGVLIAGDIYDKSVPPVEAVRLFDDFLTRLAQYEMPIFIIGGNHDSAERISFGARLMKEKNVHIASVFDGNTEPVVLQDAYGEIAVYLLPFVKPALVRHVYPEAEIDSYDAAVKVAVTNMNVDERRRNIIVAHQFVTGAVRCESEEISVGGVDQVEATAFEVFDYVALGHIHGPQQIGRKTVRYCGTPLKYSFSEATHEKSVTIVTLAEKGTINLQFVPLKPLHDMRELRGTYMQITALDYYKGTNTNDYLHITLTDEEDVPDAIGKLRAIYPNIMRLDYDNMRTRSGQTIVAEKVQNEKTPMELLEEFYALRNNQNMSDEQREYSLELLERIAGRGNA